jgi:hypothetical protein
MGKWRDALEELKAASQGNTKDAYTQKTETEGRKKERKKEEGDSGFFLLSLSLSLPLSLSLSDSRICYRLPTTAISLSPSLSLPRPLSVFLGGQPHRPTSLTLSLFLSLFPCFTRLSALSLTTASIPQFQSLSLSSVTFRINPIALCLPLSLSRSSTHPSLFHSSLPYDRRPTVSFHPHPYTPPHTPFSLSLSLSLSLPLSPLSTTTALSDLEQQTLSLVIPHRLFSRFLPELALGQVALAYDYTMQDALHAIELMTPKMDAGMHGSSATADQAHSLSHALEVHPRLRGKKRKKGEGEGGKKEP